MLAGTKPTKKYSIDPRGGVWANDETKFGHKLMEKMGWSKGKGLGANLTGDPNHVLIRKKMDNKGVGCTNKAADNWIAHQADFNSLLVNLKDDHTSEETVIEKKEHSNLDEQAKTRKNRMHYQKFTRGKDLSRFKVDDIDNIMGKRAKAVKQVEPEQLEHKDGCLTKLHGVETSTSNSNIQEYFAKKMAKLKENRDSSNSLCSESVAEPAKEVEDGYESDGIIKIRTHEPVKEEAEEEDSIEIKSEKKDKKKKSKKRKHERNEDDEDEEEITKKKKRSRKDKKIKSQEDEDDSEVVSKKKKSKKNKKNKHK